MNALLITYDLNKGGAIGKDKGQNYNGLYERIKNLGAWWHCVDSTWIVKSNYNVTAARDYLADAIDGNDLLLVVDITNKPWASRGFTGDCATWLQNNLR